MKYSFAIILIAGLFCSCQNGVNQETTELDSSFLSEKEMIKRGEYMVDVLGCADCHTPKKMGPNGPELDMSKYLMGYDSSQELPPVPENVPLGPWVIFKGDLTAAVGPWGTSYAANLTPDGTGIGYWSLDQFKKALREAKFKGLENSRPIMPPMPRHYAYLTDEDIEAVYNYLQSLEPIENVVPAYQPPAAQ